MMEIWRYGDAHWDRVIHANDMYPAKLTAIKYLFRDGLEDTMSVRFAMIGKLFSYHLVARFLCHSFFRLTSRLDWTTSYRPRGGGARIRAGCPMMEYQSECMKLGAPLVLTYFVRKRNSERTLIEWTRFWNLFISIRTLMSTTR